MNYKQYNIYKILEWRETSDVKKRNAIEMELMTTNRPVLNHYYHRWGDWAMAEIYIQLTIALKSYDIDHPKMSFIGFWKQKLNWKLPQKNIAENAFIKLPYDATQEEKDQYKEIHMINVYDFESLYGDEGDDDEFKFSDSVNYNEDESQWE